jgi:hypothetical protein
MEAGKLGGWEVGEFMLHFSFFMLHFSFHLTYYISMA